MCTFRVGEIYLTAAEAAARLGELSQARTRLLELMRKRYAPEAYEAKSVVVNAMDKEALVQEILDERARELAFEGHRWFDLRRSTRPRLEKVLDGTRYVLPDSLRSSAENRGVLSKCGLDMCFLRTFAPFL